MNVQACTAQAGVITATLRLMQQLILLLLQSIILPCVINMNNFRRKSHCSGLFQPPMAA